MTNINLCFTGHLLPNCFPLQAMLNLLVGRFVFRMPTVTQYALDIFSIQYVLKVSLPEQVVSLLS